MDKKQFIETAPLYYALAIMTALRKKAQGRALSLPGIIEVYSLPNEDDPSEPFKLLQYYPLIDLAVEFLREHKLVEIIEDDFGSPLFESKQLWGNDRPDFLDDPALPFYKYARASDGDPWLESALSSVNRKFSELGISTEDFDNPEAEWAPLPLDRSDPTLQRAVEAIDATLKGLREDNGYNATVPEERNLVVESLSTASRVLKTEATTSAPFIRQFILEPLAKLARRFGNAALGILSSAAREAVIDYLKQHSTAWIAEIGRHL